ncbi:hypothetical protein B566_EDAN012966 [Ephemera danica]|nr:hypothetical protein B566_EDAN012966 [Ephemera danica]
MQAVVVDDCLSPEFAVNGTKQHSNLLQCLLPLANIPIVDYTLAFLSSVGVQETILVCTRNSEEIKEHIRVSKWNNPGSMTVKLIVSERCQSLGDVMRELDVGDVIHGDFILMYADTVSNAKLLSVLHKHRSIIQKDKGAVMTMVYSKATPGHATRSSGTETILALDKRNGRILSHQKLQKEEHKVSFPLELFLDRPCVELCYDLLDPCISICSVAVPPLFSDNFDYQTRDDLVKGLLLNEDILGNTMYAHCLENEYAARVSNLAMFHAVSMDVIHRWTYPFVPDAGFALDRYSYIHKNNLYKQTNVKIGKSEIEDAVMGENTKIGKGCTISSSVIGKNCTIGDAVTLNHVFIWDNSIVESNFTGKYFLAPKNSHLKTSKISEPPVTTDKTFEGYGSDTDSSDDEFNANAQNIDEYEVFFSEVLDSLVRGFKETVEMDALIIEINASRFANNIPANEVNHWVLRAMLNVPEHAGSTIDKVLPFFLPILARYFSKSTNDQHQCLTAVEHEALGGSRQLLPSCGKVLMFLYNKDILEEEAIIRSNW